MGMESESTSRGTDDASANDSAVGEEEWRLSPSRESRFLSGMHARCEMPSTCHDDMLHSEGVIIASECYSFTVGERMMCHVLACIVHVLTPTCTAP
jgi:hypothetical protein